MNGNPGAPRRPGTVSGSTRAPSSAPKEGAQPIRPASAQGTRPAVKQPAKPSAGTHPAPSRTAPPRRPLPNQARIEAEKQQMAAEKKRAKEAAKEQNKEKIRKTATTLGVSLLLVGVVLLVWYFIGTAGKNPGKVDYQIGDLTYKMPYSAVTAYGVIYINFSDVANYLELPA